MHRLCERRTGFLIFFQSFFWESEYTAACRLVFPHIMCGVGSPLLRLGHPTILWWTLMMRIVYPESDTIRLGNFFNVVAVCLLRWMRHNCLQRKLNSDYGMDKGDAVSRTVVARITLLWFSYSLYFFIMIVAAKKKYRIFLMSLPIIINYQTLFDINSKLAVIIE